MTMNRNPLHRLVLAIALCGSLWGCEDDSPGLTGDASANTGDDAAIDSQTQRVMPSGSDANGNGDAPVVTVVDAALSTDEFSWSVDPMEILLQRGTCRTVTVHVQRRNGYNGPLTLGVGGGPEKVGFSTNHIEAGASTGTFSLVTATNAPAVNAAPLIVAATGDKTHLRLMVHLTVADTAPVTDGGVLEPAGADGSVFDESTCRQVVNAIGQ
jgi:hypothetical protein